MFRHNNLYVLMITLCSAETCCNNIRVVVLTVHCRHIILPVALQRDIQFYSSHLPQPVMMAGTRGATNPLLQTPSCCNSWLRTRTNLLPPTKIWTSYSNKLADPGDRAKAWFCHRLMLGLRVRIQPGLGCLCLVSVVCFHVEVTATGRSLVQRSPT
jgi:hypothetical protein